MSKGFNYPLLDNCKDIVAKLKDNPDETAQTAVKAAKFIIETSD
jgi:hypothetical protein